MDELIKRAKSGDKKAFEDIYIQTSQQIYFLSLKILKNEQDAADATQETFLQVFGSIQNLQETTAFKSWLYRIAISKCNRIIRQNNPVLLEEETDYLSNIPEMNQEFLPEYALDKAETGNMILALIDQLPVLQRETVLLYYYQQMSVSEISEVMDCSQGTVKSRLNYARQQIKQGVEEHEKNGIKLYGTGAIPVLTSLLLQEAEKHTAPQFSGMGLPFASNGTEAPLADNGAPAPTMNKPTSFIKKVTNAVKKLSTVQKVVAAVVAVAVIGGAATLIALTGRDTDFYKDIGKTLEVLQRENPEMIVNPDMPVLYDGGAQILGYEEGEFSYYFYVANGYPLLDDIVRDGFAGELKCTGIYTTVGVVFPKISDLTPTTDFFKANGISDYSIPQSGWMEFEYNGYRLVMNYSEEISNDRQSNAIPPQQIKSSYPIFVIDKLIDNSNVLNSWHNSVSNNTAGLEPLADIGYVEAVFKPKDTHNVTIDDLYTVRHIISNRLANMNITNYRIWVNEQASQMTVQFSLEYGETDTSYQEILNKLTEVSLISFCVGNTNSETILDNRDILQAQAQPSSESSEYGVLVTLTESGTAKFAEATSKLIGQTISIWVDDSMINAPVVNQAITDGKAVISGSFSQEEAEELADTINGGALPFRLAYAKNAVKVVPPQQKDEIAESQHIEAMQDRFEVSEGQAHSHEGLQKKSSEMLFFPVYEDWSGFMPEYFGGSLGDQLKKCSNFWGTENYIYQFIVINGFGRRYEDDEHIGITAFHVSYLPLIEETFGKVDLSDSNVQFCVSGFLINYLNDYMFNKYKDKYGEDYTYLMIDAFIHGIECTEGMEDLGCVISEESIAIATYRSKVFDLYHEEVKRAQKNGTYYEAQTVYESNF